MTTYSVYLKFDADAELKSSAKKEGISPLELIKKRITQGAEIAQVRVVNRKVDVLFLLMERMAQELGFITGATHSGVKNIQSSFDAARENQKLAKENTIQLRNSLAKDGIDIK